MTPVESFIIEFDDSAAREKWINVIEAQRRVFGAAEPMVEYETEWTDVATSVEYQIAAPQDSETSTLQGSETATLRAPESSTATFSTAMSNWALPRL